MNKRDMTRGLSDEDQSLYLQCTEAALSALFTLAALELKRYPAEQAAAAMAKVERREGVLAFNVSVSGAEVAMVGAFLHQDGTLASQFMANTSQHAARAADAAVH